jgi:hypothetical protein
MFSHLVNQYLVNQITSMIRKDIIIFAAIVICMQGCSKNEVPASSGPTPATPVIPVIVVAKTPNQLLDLSHWTLGLPIDANGGITGTAVSITTASLMNGYTSDYFYTKADSGVVFWAPVNGATTSGSTHPRSEFREVLKPTDNSVNWSYTTPSKLYAKLAVNQVPADTGKLVIGQIHGYGTVNVPMVLIFFSYNKTTKTATVYAGVHNASDTQAKDYTLATNIALDQKFTYELDVSDKAVLSISVNGATPINVNIDVSWKGASLYYKAGNYVQEHKASATEGGMVTFYALSATH